MKRWNSTRCSLESGPNMTPLVDVVMVILVFMMLAGSFSTAEHFLSANYANGGGEGRGLAVDIRVERGAEGRMIARFGNRQTEDTQELSRQLEGMRLQLNAIGRPTDQIPVQIIPGKLVPYRALVDVYDAALRAKFTRVQFVRSH